MVSGIGRALVMSNAMNYVVASGDRAFPEDKEEVQIKVTLLVSVYFGLTALVVPLLSSSLFTIMNFRIILDIIGGL